jgi:xanthosine utilization system XapX-like protein
MSGLSRWLTAQGKCALAGVVAGIVVGFLFEMLQFAQPARFAIADLLRIGLLLGLVGWITVLLFLGLIAGQGDWAMVLPSLLTSVVTGLLTVAIDNALWQPVTSVFVGIIVGFLVGRMLCWACRQRVLEDTTHG